MISELKLTRPLPDAALKDKRTFNERNEEMEVPSHKRTLPTKLRNEMVQWQNKIDAANLQFHLATKNAQDAMQPYIEHMETELEHAKEQWQEFERTPESGWQNIHKGITTSFKFMRHSLGKALQHFESGNNKQ